jgi:hypothetical protein
MLRERRMQTMSKADDTHLPNGLKFCAENFVMPFHISGPEAIMKASHSPDAILSLLEFVNKAMKKDAGTWKARPRPMESLSDFFSMKYTLGTNMRT